MVEPVAFRSREVCLTQADLAAFSARLVEAFPEGRYFNAYKTDAGAGQPFPSIRESLQLAELHGYETIMHFDLDWVPQWERTESGGWHLSYPHLPNIRIHGGTKVWPAERGHPENMDPIKIDISCRPHRKEDFALVRRFFAVLGKVATNRNQKSIDYSCGEVLSICEKASWLWLGHDALRWAREDSWRMFAINLHQKWGIRPRDDGVPVVAVRPPKSRPHAPDPMTWRRRNVCLAPADWRAFADLVVELFPAARCFTVPDWSPSRAAEPAAVVSALHLLDLEGPSRIIHFDETWLPNWQRDPADNAWVLPYPRLPYLVLSVDPGPLPETFREPPRILRSKLEFALRPDAAEDAALAKRLFALLPRIAARPRCRIISHQDLDWGTTDRPYAWLGHHALAWARADERRVLAFLYNLSYRPVSDDA